MSDNAKRSGKPASGAAAAEPTDPREKARQGTI